MTAEGVEFRTNANVGVNVPTADLRRNYDAILLCRRRDPGPRSADSRPRAEGRSFRHGVPAAAEQGQPGRFEFQTRSWPPERRDRHRRRRHRQRLHGTSNRQGCRSLTQFELLPQPPDVGAYSRADQRPPGTPWPYWPLILRTSTSHEEGCDREFEHPDQGIPRRCKWPRRKPGHRAHRVDQRRTGPPHLQRSRGHGAGLALPTRAAGDGLSRPGKARPDRPIWISKSTPAAT